MNHLFLSNKLKELRKKNSYTQTYISEQLNIGRSTYSNYELGKRMPSLDMIMAFAKFYHISVDELLFPEEECKTSIFDGNGQQLSDDENYLVTQYRRLSADHKHVLLEFSAFLPAHGKAF